MKTAFIAVIAIGVIVAGSIVAVFTMSSNSNSGLVQATTAKDKPVGNKSAQEIITQILSPSIDKAQPLGNNSAKITVVEFGDYQCTWCHNWHSSTKDMFLSNYVDTGKVRFLFKDYPINDLSDKASSMAAQASYCAADQGKYWKYHDELYNNWKGENTGWVTKESLERFATNVGISDMSTFSSCLNSGKYAGVVKDNYNLATSIGLDATPSFIILAQGHQPQLLKGAYPYSAFEKVIDSISGGSNS